MFYEYINLQNFALREMCPLFGVKTMQNRWRLCHRNASIITSLHIFGSTAACYRIDDVWISDLHMHKRRKLYVLIAVLVHWRTKHSVFCLVCFFPLNCELYPTGSNKSSREWFHSCEKFLLTRSLAIGVCDKTFRNSNWENWANDEEKLVQVYPALQA